MLQRLAAVFAVILAGIGLADAVGAADVSAVRVGVHPGKTRLVLELSEKVPYRIFTLSEPYRVVVDLPQVGWNIPQNQPAGPTGVVTSYRYGLFQKGNSRLVVDVAKPVNVSQHIILPPSKRGPHRLVIDLNAVTRAEFDRAERTLMSRGWVDVTPTSVPVRRPGDGVQKPGKRRRGPARRIVVVDPGHGGPDPGAIGASGVREKDVTLRIAKTVRRVLEATGRYRVFLTRSEDVYVPLRRRFEMAEGVGGELFISLHADSNKDRSLRGASIYTLSERSSDKEAAALAAKENRSDAIAGIDLSNQSDAVASFLIELRQRQTMNESAIFSGILIKEVGQDIRLLRNTHRFAGFAVLKSPDVPSVLVEIGYLSNRGDERLLKNGKYRTKAAQAILRAADRYSERKERLSRS